MKSKVKRNRFLESKTLMSRISEASDRLKLSYKDSSLILTGVVIGKNHDPTCDNSTAVIGVCIWIKNHYLYGSFVILVLDLIYRQENVVMAVCLCCDVISHICAWVTS
ncbi:hypothetical protein BX666DRAFT_1924560 [Dichotomocladium elegans]|nr:hypothetical protein BX666DRAFT_1924560 [Dichotomocladium elegans]